MSLRHEVAGDEVTGSLGNPLKPLYRDQEHVQDDLCLVLS